MKLRLTLAALLLTSTSAFAADLAPQAAEPAAPAAAPIYDWTGFYVGVDAGAIFGKAKFDAPSFPAHGSVDSTGFVGGAHAGYNLQFDGSFVVGLETDIDYSSLSKTKHLTADQTPFDVDAKSGWQGSTRARVGYAFDNILPYLTAGVAYGNQKLSATFPDGSASLSDTRFGWTAGGGVEYAVDQNWLVRGEVRYTDFGNGSTNILNAAVKTRFNNVSTTLGASYKF